jgi:DNA-binding NarL/FixJ family response regulator
LETSPVRVLVVEDYEPFRRFVCSTLGKSSDSQVGGEAHDGLEAIHKAEELQPDLIVLDIGLPRLNGIEVARRIRKLSPESEMLFVSQESSVDVVQEALRTGALGYVVKTHAGIELLAAVEAVRRGEQFISGGVPRKAEIIRSHAVEFYSDDAAFVVGFTHFIEAALKAGKALIVVATESHRKSLQKLQERGVDVASAIEQGRYPLWISPTRSRPSWGMICLTQRVFLESWMI